MERRARSCHRMFSSYEYQINQNRSKVIESIIRVINQTPAGCMHLKELESCLKLPLQVLWNEIKSHYPSNFVLNTFDAKKGVNEFNGDEQIWVKSSLNLCDTHCRKKKDCDGNCGALHLCKTYLLLSAECCPFHMMNRCKFGHNFHSSHNAQLLIENNLGQLDENELRRLFRRRLSRSENTMPSVCFFYNKEKGNCCSNKNCRSLHLCEKFIMGTCNDHCRRNHSFEFKQVVYVLELHAIDKSWTDEMILTDLKRMKESVPDAASESTEISCSDEDASSSQCSLDDFNVNETVSAHSPAQHLKAPSQQPFNIAGSFGNDATSTNKTCCERCQESRKEMHSMKETIIWLTTEVTQLKRDLEDIRSVRRKELDNNLLKHLP